MDDDQQFCLRWNNHQSTLVAVFDTLLENGTLVDCTLAAEGKCLNAHKVVLSACSPYFEALLSKHFDKHPILILKDVKFQELKAMMDYMYRGEVNISQDQLGALLKAAESLQIKGLSDNRKGETSDRKPTPAAPPPKSPQPASTLPKVQGLTIEQRAREDSREGSMSPGPRKKKRLRRKSEELDNHDASNSSESHSLPAQSIPMLPAITKMNADVPDQVETKSEILTRHKQIEDTIPQVPIIKEKIETHTELMLEPKSEYVDEMNEDSIEDLTLDDDDLSNMEQVDDQAGPSHGAGEGSSQGFGGWHMGNQSQDEVFLAAQEAVGAHRDSQDENFESMEAGTEIFESLPEKSKEKYQKEYSLFNNWRIERNLQGVLNEEIMMEYLQGIGEVYKPSSLLTRYSMLKTTLKVFENVDIASYKKLAVYLKAKIKTHKAKRAKALEKWQIEKFLMEAPDQYYLLMKVVLIIAISGACRCEELTKLTVDDIEDKGSHLLITLPNPITNVSRRFIVINDRFGMDVLDIYNRYASLRPHNVGHNRFFLNYRKEKCTVQPVGINTLSRVPKEIATYLNLPDADIYTGHSFRRSSACFMSHVGG
ncbi:longitudinals lacking protein, isoforms H/M/V isoform X2 [Diorhabda carinulata]|uniref:longitudinals lacking protein, isoforms H/M/V-like isoform X2 n=1 Tax=Diorhabda sublineata TaxID=1163346 RepID=UPI0024E15033|nr:longitudinals lacking protein, isoforms H/M/V-like isoform X2 [Diorhabda sublineata]XP_057672587.1 longitudinals lacking protein, isoforms H/M/V isoform X2 [Diorhabda carinulata]